MKTNIFFIFAFCCSISSFNAKSQLAIGVEPFVRFASDKAGNSQGMKFCMQIDADDDSSDKGKFIVTGFFSYSKFRPIGGTANLDEYKDSIVLPNSITVKMSEKISDYMLNIGGMYLFQKDKKKNDGLFLSFGLSGVMRLVQVKYLENVDESKYLTKYPRCNPRVPGALNIGFRIGAGYNFQLSHLILQPNFSIGFGSADNGNNHPWNSYPTHADVGVKLMFTNVK